MLLQESQSTIPLVAGVLELAEPEAAVVIDGQLLVVLWRRGVSAEDNSGMHIALLRVWRSLHTVGVPLEGGLVHKQAPFLHVHCLSSRLAVMARAVRFDSYHGVDEVVGTLPATLLATLESPIFAAPLTGGRTFRLVQQGNPPTK